MFGSSAADIHLTGQVNLQARTDGPLGVPETLNAVATKSVVSPDHQPGFSRKMDESDLVKFD